MTSSSRPNSAQLACLLNELQHYQLFCSEFYLQTRRAGFKENHRACYK